MAQVEIAYEDGQAKVIVLMKAASLEFFKKAAADPALASENGAELVAALLARSRGAIRMVERYRDGQRNDGPRGERALEEFNNKGVLVRGVRYRDGKLNDGLSGERAWEAFNNKGILAYGERYRDGERTEVLTKQKIREINAVAPLGALGNQIRVLAP